MFFHVGEPFFIPSLLVKRCPDGGGDFEHDADAAQEPVRISATFLVRIQNGYGIGEPAFPNLVVVADDDIESYLIGERGFLHGGDAAVGGEDQDASAVADFFERLLVHAVSLDHSLGDVVIVRRIQFPEEMDHQCGGGDPVHIVIPIHGDFLPGFNSRDDAVHGLFHPQHQKRVVKLCEVGLEEKFGFGRGFNFTVYQQPGHDGRQVKLPCKSLLLFWRRLGYCPSFVEGGYRHERLQVFTV